MGLNGINPVATVLWTFLLGASGLAVASVLLSRRRARTWPRATARLLRPPGPVRIANRRMSVAFDTPAGAITARLRGPVTLTEDDAGSRNETVLVAYDPADPRRVTLAANGPYGRGALLVWGLIFAALLALFLHTQVLR
ncbi:DUF3592 domain-containing protein [Roseomonas sp. CCTCC AB2023176]|uniref:DUF3592 domain-containing protein n=1 Tax=Roseomonas sp. CCTCC AB2023176 TaxID=3342640 RepID=UPI0035DB0A08